MDANKAIPVLVIEDDILTNTIISDIATEIPNIEVVVVETREQAFQVLSSRNDFLVAFVDWNLLDGTSEWVIETIYATQSQIIDIFATSSCDKTRQIQLVCEWATAQLDQKFDILTQLQKIPEIIQ